MAREIRETPVLTGKDAARFEKNIKESQNNRVSPTEYNKAKAAHQMFGFSKTSS